MRERGIRGITRRRRRHPTKQDSRTAPADEISRLRVGCIRRQHGGQPIDDDSREVLAEEAVCLLDVPVNKTSTAFTQPVDPIIGQAIEAWQALRPDQPKRLDILRYGVEVSAGEGRRCGQRGCWMLGMEAATGSGPAS
ncbi:hypothetical protein [Streptomyces sp. NPDC048527]|uniref:hypothetical protein n=1 Tax=Streptomyces sp. NPDC048527 TaxID=3365568 RepID=UPI00370FE829